MKKLLNNFQETAGSLQKDKLLHFFFGTFIAFGLTSTLSSGYMILGTLIVAVSKELLDKYVRKTAFSVSDISATMIPAFLFYIILITK